MTRRPVHCVAAVWVAASPSKGRSSPPGASPVSSFDFYNGRHPIGIARVWIMTADGAIDRTTPRCLVLLSGTEPGVLDQATTLPEDMQAAIDDWRDDAFHQAIIRALKAAVRQNYCDAGARLIMAGHSLGGMEAQTVAADLAMSGAPLGASNIVTSGSPWTAGLPRYVSIRRFTTIGDPIPYTTSLTNTYREVTQVEVSDLTGEARSLASYRAQQMRIVALGWTPQAADAFSGTAVFARWMAGAVGAHMDYPNVMELGNYDALGDRLREIPGNPSVRRGTRLLLGAPVPGGGTGTGLHIFSAPRT